MKGLLKYRFVFAALLVIIFARQSLAQVAGDSSILEEQKRIHDTFNYLLENNRFTEFLDLTTIVDFPIGIKKTIGNIDYVIAIDSVVFTPTYAYLNASMSFIPPEGQERLAFRGTNIRFTQQGGISGDARLELVGDHTLNIPGNKISLVLKGEGTYVEWDCDGFKEFGISGGINFSRDLIIPVDLKGEAIEGEVMAELSLILSDWNDLVASIKIAPFQLKGLNGFTFNVEEALFDFSDLRNPTGVIFPEDYESPYFLPGNNNLWRGVYIKSVSLSLPPQFTKEDGKIPHIIGNNILLDNLGLSGNIGAKYLVSLNDGSSSSMQGWPFSIDEIELNFINNKINYSFLEGEFMLPITNEASTLAYTAFIDHENNYFFTISPSDSLSFELWQAGEVKLYESSFITVEVREGQFVPSANLNGRMSIGAPIGESNQVKLTDIQFENLLLKAEAPFISGGIFSVGSESSLPKMAGFTLDVEKLQIRNLPDSTISLDIEAGVILNGDKAGNFSAYGGFSIISEKSSLVRRQQWHYKKTAVKKISLNVENEAFTFKGDLEFYSDDNVFGNGFSGNILAKFKPGIEVQAAARFGRTKQFKYWYADALASFNKAIPVAPGFGIYGFGGGAYYHMKMAKSTQNQDSTSSGMTYLPDTEAGLGLRAAIKFGSTLTNKAYNGDAAFEIAFYNSGGIRNINFKGEAYFMTPGIEVRLEEIQANIDKILPFPSNKDQPEDLLGTTSEATDKQPSEISGHVNINYDFTNQILHGNLEIFVNAAGGMVKGIGNNGRAGWAVLHFAPAEWYVHIGTPSNRIGLSMGLQNINAQANAYFMVGTKIPASPPPNDNVSRILGGLNLDYMRDENALGMGSGYAMGAALGFDTGNLTFWKFYARFMAEAGFDLMLKDYGSDVSCANQQGTIGINGWYANGQAYAFFDGEIGILVDVFGKTQEIEIINLAAAAILQAKLPNPIWMHGVVGGYFSALGGLVKGDCRFEVTIGKECELQGGSAVSGIKVIADVTPANGNNDVSVFNNPQAIFNMPVGEVFELVDIDNKRKLFRIKLDHLRVNTTHGQLAGTLAWNTNLDVVIFKANEIFPPETELVLDVQISFEEKEGGNWIPVTTGGNIIIEREKIIFTTGTAPDFIPLNNIVYSYPVVEMVNYYADEYEDGYIQLDKGQSYLFNTDDNQQQIGKLLTNTSSKDFAIEYNTDRKRLAFELPDLETGQIYTLQLINTPLAESEAIDRNVTVSASTVDGAAGGAEIIVSTKQAEGTIDSQKETLLFSTPFRTSVFRTFKEKVAAIVVENTMRLLIMEWDQHLLKSSLITREHFEKSEIEGTRFTEFKPLLNVKAVLTANKYYENQIYPLIYKDYPIDGVAKILQRDIGLIGVPPVEAIEIDYSEFSSTNSLQNNVLLISTGKTNLIYDLPRYYRHDFYEIREKVVPLYINHPVPLPAQVNALMFHSFPFVNEGEYMVRFNYFLPGESTPHSSYLLNTILDFNK